MSLQNNAPPLDQDPLRILVLSNMYPKPSYSLGGIFVHEQVLALRDRGIDVQVLSGEAVTLSPRRPGHLALNLSLFCKHQLFGESWGKWDSWDGVPVYRFYYPLIYPYKLRQHGIFYNACARHAINEVSEKFPFDLIHAHSSFMEGSAAVKAKAHLRVPSIITEHTGPFSTFSDVPAIKSVVEKAMNRADKILVPSKWQKGQILESLGIKNPGKLSVLPNGVNTDLFAPGDSLPLGDGPIFATWVGFHVRVKQLSLLIKALDMAREHEPRLRLRLVGSTWAELDTWQEVLGRELSPYVSFHPQATRGQIAEFLRDSHFLVISSKSETFGLSAIEAMSCGRPVLTTDCGGPAETINDQRLGIVTKNSPEGLAEGFLEIVKRLESFDFNALHKHAVKYYSLDTIAERLEEIYQEFLPARNSSRTRPREATGSGG